jgi:riboflavin kinase / FMN adenylyltransferase
MPLARIRSAEEWIRRLGESRRGTTATIGNFDGMHRGHQEILRRVIEQARQADLIAAVLTFFPHPVRVLRPAEAPSLLMTLDQRLAAFEAAGMDAVLVLPFDESLSKMSADDFARTYLVDSMRARKIFVGENFRFGHRQQGDVKALEDFGRQWGFETEIVGSLTVDGMVVSSTAVREAVRDGRMQDAQRLLGRPFELAGEIQTGTGQGRRLIVPTLNLATEQEMLPRKAVYATETLVNGRAYGSVTNVGVRPTFNGAGITVESHLFDFNENLTAGELRVRFWALLRHERKFAGPQELREQVWKDIEQAQEFHRQRKG